MNIKPKPIGLIGLVGLVGLICLASSQAMAVFNTSTQESIENLKDALGEEVRDFAKEKVDSTTQVIGNEVSDAAQSIIRKIPGKALEILKNVSKKALVLVKGGLNNDVRQWFSNRTNAVKQGLEEEKQELGGNAKEILSAIWEKIKNWTRAGD